MHTCTFVAIYKYFFFKFSNDCFAYSEGTLKKAANIEYVCLASLKIKQKVFSMKTQFSFNSFSERWFKFFFKHI